MCGWGMGARALACVAAATWAVLAMFGASAHAAKRVEVGGCTFASRRAAPEKARAIQATTRAVAFSAVGADGREVFACRRGARARSLGLSATCPLGCAGIRAVQLSDRYAAWEDVTAGSRDGDDHDLVRVRSLTSKAPARSIPSGGSSRVLGDPPYRSPLPGSVTDLLLRADGSVAWIAQAESGRTPTHSVWISAAGMPPRQLDDGPDVRAGSLAAAARRLYWTRGETAVSAPIP